LIYVSILFVFSGFYYLFFLGFYLNLFLTASRGNLDKIALNWCCIVLPLWF